MAFMYMTYFLLFRGLMYLVCYSVLLSVRVLPRISRISVFQKTEKTGQTVRLIELEKGDCHSTLLLLPGHFKLYSLLLQCSGRVQYKNRVDLVEM